MIISISLEESVGELDVFFLSKSLSIEFSLMSFGPCAECLLVGLVGWFRMERLSNGTIFGLQIRSCGRYSSVVILISAGGTSHICEGAKVTICDSQLDM